MVTELIGRQADALNITQPGVGNFALIKDPEKKQLLLSSPSTGQRAFDWAIRGGGMNQKQDTDRHENPEGPGHGKGHWVHLADGSTLSAVLE